MAAISDLYATAEAGGIRCHDVGDLASYGTFNANQLRSNSAAVKAELRKNGFHLDADRVGRAVNSHAVARRIADAAGIVI